MVAASGIPSSRIREGLLVASASSLRTFTSGIRHPFVPRIREGQVMLNGFVRLRLGAALVTSLILAGFAALAFGVMSFDSVAESTSSQSLGVPSEQPVRRLPTARRASARS